MWGWAACSCVLVAQLVRKGKSARAREWEKRVCGVWCGVVWYVGVSYDKRKTIRLSRS